MERFCALFQILGCLHSGKVEVMQSGISRVAAALALLTCLICSILEMFDRWDHTLQTGQDTEYSLVLLALCLGAAYAFVNLVVRCVQLNIFATLAAYLRCGESLSLLLHGNDGLSAVLIDRSPPRLPLRI